MKPQNGGKSFYSLQRLIPCRKISFKTGTTEEIKNSWGFLYINTGAKDHKKKISGHNNVLATV